MAGRICLFLLKKKFITIITVLVALTQSVNISAEEKQAPLQIQSEQLIQPEIQRRKVDLAAIDTEDFEATAFTGLFSVEDFGVNLVFGARLAYHLNEDLFVEGTLGFSKAGQTSYERISGTPLPVLSGNNSNITYLNVSLGYNLLPGEGFLTQKTSFNTALYLVAGIGSTTFGGADRLTLTLGGGYRILATDWLALHISVRDHLFNINILAEDKTANNFEVSFGVSAFF